MTLSCNCDMPIEIYCDWLQDQGWGTDELRATDDAICDWCEFSDIEYRWRGNGSNNMGTVFSTPNYLYYEGGDGRQTDYCSGVGSFYRDSGYGAGDQEAGEGYGITI